MADFSSEGVGGYLEFIRTPVAINLSSFVSKPFFQVQYLSKQLEESPEDQDELDLIKSELAETIGKDQLVEKLARIRTKSETRDRRMSETSGRISPNKSGSGVNLNSSQENLRKRTSEAKDEGPKSPQKPKANEKQVGRFSVAFD